MKTPKAQRPLEDLTKYEGKLGRGSQARLIGEALRKHLGTVGKES